MLLADEKGGVKKAECGFGDGTSFSEGSITVYGLVLH